MKAITTTTTTGLLAVLTVLVSSTSTAAPAAPRPDRVERVVVFSDRAEVTRTAVARCDGGVAAVVDLPAPTSVAELRRFVGLAGWLRKFVKGFAGLSACFNPLFAKGARWEWTEERQAAFEQRLGQATPLADYLFAELRGQTDPETLAGRARLAELARPLLENSLCLGRGVSGAQG